jgi:FMN phosphatase YigB (HAD superfamily)
MSDQKLILTDADGVLFDWVTGFNEWMEGKGWNRLPEYEYHYTIEHWYNISKEHAMELVSQYNSSAAIGFLPPYLDSVEYVKKLHDLHGYRFVVITAMGHDQYAIKLRKRNLKDIFGDIFEDVVVVDLLQSKAEILKLYEPTYWIEDKPSAAEEGNALGHKTFLFEHGHNGHMRTNHEITRVHNWREVYKVIAAEEMERELPKEELET